MVKGRNFTYYNTDFVINCYNYKTSTRIPTNLLYFTYKFQNPGLYFNKSLVVVSHYKHI